MSLRPLPAYVVPDQTAQVARAIFPQGNAVMRLFDDLHMVVEDQDVADLFPTRGRPAAAPVRLALATLLQCSEGLTDRQAADATYGGPCAPGSTGSPCSVWSSPTGASITRC